MVVAYHLDRGFELAQVLDEVVGEAVVVVQHEDAHAYETVNAGWVWRILLAQSVLGCQLLSRNEKRGDDDRDTLGQISRRCADRGGARHGGRGVRREQLVLER